MTVFQPRDPTCISCTGRQIFFFYCWAIWEAPKSGDSQERLHIKEWESLRVGSWDTHFQQVLQNELLMLPLEFMKYRLLRHSAPHVSLVLTWLCLFSKVRVWVWQRDPFQLPWGHTVVLLCSRSDCVTGDQSTESTLKWRAISCSQRSIKTPMGLSPPFLSVNSTKTEVVTMDFRCWNGET